MHLQEWGKAILQAAVIIVILFFFCWPMRISGSSMESTMKDGEIVLMSRFATMQEKYETGDIVMFHYYDADGGKTVVKRIIATEGDHIRILADGGERSKIAGGICPRQNGRSGGYDCAEGNGICDGG